MKMGDHALRTPREIYEQLGRFVIGQERAKRAVAIAAHNHRKRIAARREGPVSLLKKSNLLLIGPTGSGKTHIARQLAKVLDVPFAVADATEFTEAGYYGKDVEVMLADLLQQADHDVRRAETGILFLDEIDKIARRSQWASTGAGSRDIGGEGVQQALLKLLEGRKVMVPSNVGQHWSKHEFVTMDTSDVLFICAGTFTDLLGSPAATSVGFQRHGARRGAVEPRRLTTRHLVDYGMLAELLGRLPVVTQLEELALEELVGILEGPPDAIVREYRQLVALDGVELSFTQGALRRIAALAWERGIGARGLRAVMEELMEEILFLAPERPGQPWTVDARYVEARFPSSKEALRAASTSSSLRR